MGKHDRRDRDSGARTVAAGTQPGPADDGPLAAAAAATLTALPPAVAKKLGTWEPMLQQRQLTDRHWRTLEPLVRAAATCARPSSPSVAGDLLGVALSLALFATARRMPLRPERVFSAVTVQAWLATVDSASARTYTSQATALTKGVTRALSTPAPPTAPNIAAPAAMTPGGDLSEGGTDDPLEPLLMADGAPAAERVARAGLDTPAGSQALAALAAVRAEVLRVEPSALRAQPRFAGRGRAVPYGDVEVIALLAAAATQRSSKRKVHAAAAICLGVGAGVTGERAAAVTGTDITDRDGVLTVTTTAGTAVVHAAFAAPLRAAARAAGTGYVIGGGHVRRNRISQIADGLGSADPHLVRLSGARLGATWLAMQAVRGVPLRELLTAAGLSSTTSLDQVLPFLPANTPYGTALLAGLDHAELDLHDLACSDNEAAS